MTTDPTVMAEAGMLREHPDVDLLWIVAAICFFVVFSLFIVLIIVFARSYSQPLPLRSLAYTLFLFILFYLFYFIIMSI